MEKNCFKVFLNKDSKDSAGFYMRSCQTIRLQIKLFALEQLHGRGGGALFTNKEILHQLKSYITDSRQ